MEYVSAKDSGAAVVAKQAGIAERVTAREILVRRTTGVDGNMVEGELDRYKIQNFIRSYQGTCYNQKPIIKAGDPVVKSEILEDDPSMDGGELALGRNVLVGFMT
jgi:DNA-directed RNA polymerase subunit beta